MTKSLLVFFSRLLSALLAYSRRRYNRGVLLLFLLKLEQGRKRVLEKAERIKMKSNGRGRRA